MTKRTLNSEGESASQQSVHVKRVKQYNPPNEQPDNLLFDSTNGCTRLVEPKKECDDISTQDDERMDSPSGETLNNSTFHSQSGEMEELRVPKVEEETDFSSNSPLSTYAQQITPIHSVPSESARSSHSSSFHRSKLPESVQNRWDPINFGFNNFYNSDAGVPCSREDCEARLEKLVRNPKEFDYYNYLTLASKCHGVDPEKEQLAVGLSVTTAICNSLMKKIRNIEKTVGLAIKPSKNNEIVPGKGFNVDLASEDEDTLLLPSGKSFKLSQIVTPYMASSLTSSRFERDLKSLIRKVLNEVAPRDPFFATYTSAESSTQGYISIGEPFFLSFSNFFIQGFGQEKSKPMSTYVIALVRDAFSNFIDRHRHSFNATMSTSSVTLASELTAQLAEKDKHIRCSPIDFSQPAGM
uniref:Uncharacterized protein n=1 Tax=Caenorhabditis japonica TaxID=281687 RepID=A0A8R1HMP7_CAEJA